MRRFSRWWGLYWGQRWRGDSLVGRLIGVGFAPYTAGNGVLSACCAVIGPSPPARCVSQEKVDAPWIFCTLCYAVYVGRALTLDALCLALVTTGQRRALVVGFSAPCSGRPLAPRTDWLPG